MNDDDDSFLKYLDLMHELSSDVEYIADNFGEESYSILLDLQMGDKTREEVKESYESIKRSFNEAIDELLRYV